jgi:NAD(P)-dependent dehydrogenase (short-subunit alcohol dehydrogenase family)
VPCFGGIDIIVNNAAIIHDGFIFKADALDWGAVIGNNLSTPLCAGCGDAGAACAGKGAARRHCLWLEPGLRHARRGDRAKPGTRIISDSAATSRCSLASRSFSERPAGRLLFASSGSVNNALYAKP